MGHDDCHNLSVRFLSGKVWVDCFRQEKINPKIRGHSNKRFNLNAVLVDSEDGTGVILQSFYS